MSQTENSSKEEDIVTEHQVQTLQKKPQVSPMALNVTESLLQQAEQMVKSGLLPDSIQTAQGAVVVMQYGRELGFPPMASFKNIYVVNGTPSLATKATAGLLYQGGIRWKTKQDYEPIMGKDQNGNEIVQDMITTIVMSRDGIEESLSFRWSDAVRAGLTGKSVWKQYPKNMMYWRCFSMLADRVAPDLLLGMPDAAVMGDIHDVEYKMEPDGSIDITPED
jgi:hypothetical protein